MSATSVLPMCIRASRGLLRLRNGAAAASSWPSVADIVRTVSTEQPPVGTGTSVTGGLAQAILQERLQQQQQQQSQVRRLARCVTGACFVAPEWPAVILTRSVVGYGEYPPARVAPLNKTATMRLRFCDIFPFPTLEAKNRANVTHFLSQEYGTVLEFIVANRSSHASVTIVKNCHFCCVTPRVFPNESTLVFHELTSS